MAWIFVLSRLAHAYVHCHQQQSPRPRRVLRHRRAGAGDHVADLHRPDHARAAVNDSRRTARRRNRGADRHRRAARPAPDTLKDWGLSHRFAGSGDRAAIAGLVYDALRRRASSAYLMGEDTPRATLLGMLVRERGLDIDAVARLADGARLCAAAADRGRARAARRRRSRRRAAARAGDYPEWLDPHLARVFGDERAEEGAALASRAPLDLRVNTLKANRDEAARLARRSRARADALVAARPAHQARAPTPRARRSMPSPPISRA